MKYEIENTPRRTRRRLNNNLQLIENFCKIVLLITITIAICKNYIV